MIIDINNSNDQALPLLFVLFSASILGKLISLRASDQTDSFDIFSLLKPETNKCLAYKIYYYKNFNF